MSFARVGAADHRLRLAALLMLTDTRRTVLMLAGCQALSMTGGSIVGLTGAIVGNMLTPDKALSTLPIAVQQAGVMAATIPVLNDFLVFGTVTLSSFASGAMLS